MSLRPSFTLSILMFFVITQQCFQGFTRNMEGLCTAGRPIHVLGAYRKIVFTQVVWEWEHGKVPSPHKVYLRAASALEPSRTSLETQVIGRYFFFGAWRNNTEIKFSSYEKISKMTFWYHIVPNVWIWDEKLCSFSLEPHYRTIIMMILIMIQYDSAYSGCNPALSTVQLLSDLPALSTVQLLSDFDLFHTNTHLNSPGSITAHAAIFNAKS